VIERRASSFARARADGTLSPVRTRIDWTHAAPGILAALSLVTYVGVARGVLNVYPFSTYSMYAEGHSSSASRLGVRDARGVMHEVEDYSAYHCDGPLRTEASRCENFGRVDFVPYIDRAAHSYVETHSGDAANAEPVEIVRRIWTFTDGRAPASVHDCVLHHCRASRSGPGAGWIARRERQLPLGVGAIARAP
jgi:hypothetical protein